jgi:hypothetical protein
MVQTNRVSSTSDLQGQSENVAFVLRQPDDAGSRWDHSVLSYFMNLLALPAPAIMDVFDDVSGASPHTLPNTMRISTAQGAYNNGCAACTWQRCKSATTLW